MTLNTVGTNRPTSNTSTASTSSDDAAELQEVIVEAPSLRALSEEHIAALLRTARIERFPAEHTIGNEGAKAENLYLVLKGEVCAYLGNSMREVSGMISRGGVFGGNLLVGEPNLFSYAAERDTLVASWSDDALRRADAAATGLRKQLSIRLSKDARIVELADVLQHAPLLRNTSSVLRYRLLQEATLMRFPSGEFLYRDGEPSTMCYIVVSGEAEITRATSSGERETTAVHGRGGMLGDTDLLASSPRTESAQVTLETEVLAIARIDIEALKRADGAFRLAVAARLGSSKPLSKPQDIILLVNGTRYDARSAASLIRSSLASIGEKRVVALEVEPEGTGRAAGDDLRLQIPRDPARGIELLDERVRSLGARYVIVYTSVEDSLKWLAEPVWDDIIDNRISSTVYFTDDLKRSFPVETPQLTSVQYVEVRPAGNKDEQQTVRSGAIRLAVDQLSPDMRFESLTQANRTALHRLARTLTRQSVGLALGGGSAWGFAHVPLVRGLVEAGIPIDMLSGTSMGSVVAVGYASRGMDAMTEFLDKAPEFAWRLAFSPITRKPMDSLCRRMLPHERLQDLPIPAFPVAVDIQTGRASVFRHGSILHALKASTAVPVAIVPEIVDGVRYVDGGIMNNVPVSCLVEEGADFIIASNVIPAPLRLPREKHKWPITQILSQLSPFGRYQDALRSMYLMMRDAGTRQAAAAQVTFAPSVRQYSMVDIQAGRKIAGEVEPEVPAFVELVKQKYKAFCRNRDY
ncbi:cyclic nucleotide-binding and patatin-like phospholipase domain-containing protein [Sorangium sp. So ce136]|uniref:cyclic nucleotide-binding domain-containing protein n=1 Tax=Sorangium sp. So ce136 TaxID=3133284 RepID=UPI003F05DA65